MKKLLAIAFAFLLSFSVYSNEVVTLTEDNVISLSDSFSKASVAKLMEKATILDSNLKSGYPMYLVLYTPGGSIQAGLELFDYLDSLNRPIHTITVFAASMGFQAVQHLGKRYITRYGVLMSHKAKGVFSGEFGGGVSQIDSRYGLWLRRVLMMDKMTVKKSKGILTLKKYYELYAPELWLNGQEAVTNGIADAVATVKCDISLRGVKKITYNLGFITLNVLYSKCPTRTSALGVEVTMLTNKGEMSVRDFMVKGGKFGKKCRLKSIASRKDYFGTMVPSRPADLCSLDKKLTFDKIQKIKNEKLKFVNRNLRDFVEYSY